MSHLIILPIVLPALVAPFIIMVLRHHLDLQRVFSVAACIVLIGLTLTTAYTLIAVMTIYAPSLCRRSSASPGASSDGGGAASSPAMAAAACAAAADTIGIGSTDPAAGDLGAGSRAAFAAAS